MTEQMAREKGQGVIEQALAETEREQLLTELQRREMQLETMTKIARSTITALNPDRLMRRTVNLIQERFGFYYVGLFLVDENGQQAALRAGTGQAGRQLRAAGQRFALDDESIVGWSVTHIQPRIAPNVTLADSHSAVNLDNLYLSETRSKMALPLTVRGAAIGALTVHSTEANAFSQRDAVTLQPIADQLAVAIENARSYQAAHKEIHKCKRAEQLLQALNQAALAMEKALTPQEVFAAVGQAFKRLELSCVVFLVDENLQHVFPTYLSHKSGLIKATEKLTGIETKDFAISVQSVELYKKVVCEKQTVYLEDATEATRQTLPGFAKRFAGQIVRLLKMSRFIAAPLIVKGDVVGVFTVQSNDLTPDDVPAITAFAHQVAATWHKTQLFEQAQQEIAERMRAEAEITRLKEFNEEIVQNTLEGIVVQDDDAYISFVNPSAAALLGYMPQELVGQHWTLIVPPDQRPIVKAADERRLQGQADRYELELVHKNGSRRTVLVSGSPRFAEGHFIGTMAVFTDITQRKRAEEALQRRTAQLEALRQLSLELTAELDLETLLHSIVSQAIDLLGGSSGGLYLYRPKQDLLEWSIGIGPGLPPLGSTLRRGEGLCGRVWERGERFIINDYWQWEGRADVFEGLPNVAAAGVLVRWGEEFLGVLNVLANVPHTFSAADAELLDLFAIQAAIAIRNARWYQEAQSRAERLAVVNRIARAVGTTLHLDALLETVYQEVASTFAIDAFFIALYDKEAHELDFRLQIDQGVRQNPERQAADTGLTSLVIARKEPLLIQDFEQESDRLPTPKLWGTMESPTSWLGVPMLISERLIGVICVQAYHPHAYGEEDQLLLSTIADQIAVALEKARLYQTLHDSLEQLRDLDRLKTQFVQNVSHELRTPLAIARGYTELLENGALGELQPQQQEAMDIVVRHILDLTAMVDDITAILEVETGELDQKLVQLDNLVQNMIGHFQTVAQQKGVELLVEIAPRLPPVLGDAVQLGRALDNLLDNALKFTPAGGQVTVRLESHDDPDMEQKIVRLEVADTGIGIPADQLERIFERFYQVDGSTTRRYGGTGLGLALVQEIVKAQAGQVTVQSTLEKGSSFQITLPAFPVSRP